MHTERFRELRKKELSALLDKKIVASVWRKIVRGQLRSTDIKDLFDHYDFNYSIEDRAVALKNEILEGSYTVSAPLIYRVEKKYGVCRHLVIPQPVDALVVQLLVESVSEKILQKQPSQNAFYSRDKHNVKKPHEAVEYGLSFRQQWKKLQKKIYQFNEDKELIVVTDLSNYYDSIDLDELRKVFVSQAEVSEVVVDLLFRVIQGVAWSPDYLPNSRRGLPIANIEAMRLLAHSFLFEIDAVLKKKSGHSFARWMDDITVGVDSKKEAVALLSAISDMLKSRGLALNLSKTAILDTDAAKYNFQIDENLYLDSLESIVAGTDQAVAAEKLLRKNFKWHFKDQRPKHWDKVAKRYVTAFGRLKSKNLLDHIGRLYLSHPVLRPNFIIYLSTLGFSIRAAKVVLEVLKKLDVFDDVSLFQISNLVVCWEIPRTKSASDLIKSIESEIVRLGFEHKEASGFHAILWFKAKYSDDASLYDFIKKYQNFWQANSFLRRQVTSCLARFNRKKHDGVTGMLVHQALSGVQGTVSVATQVMQFGDFSVLESKVRMYLFPDKAPVIYPLSKFIVLCAFLNSDKIRSDLKVRQLALGYINDPGYREILKKAFDVA
jgi:hypothetical protein